MERRIQGNVLHSEVQSWIVAVRKAFASIQAAFRKGLIYAVSASALAWIVMFCYGIIRFHVIGHAPDGILWLATQHMPWGETLDKSAYLASVCAVVMFWFAAAVTLLMNLLGLLIIGIFLLLPKRGQR